MLMADYFNAQAAIARQLHPTTKATPPNGVIAPSHLIPVKLKAYKLPEKIITPAINAHPDVTRNGVGFSNRVNNNPTNNPSC